MAVRRGMFGSRSRGNGRKSGYDTGQSGASALMDRIERAAAECFGGDAPLERLAELLERIAADKASENGGTFRTDEEGEETGREERPGEERGFGSEGRFGSEGAYGSGRGGRRYSREGRYDREGAYDREGRYDRESGGYPGGAGVYARGVSNGQGGSPRETAAGIPQRTAARLPQASTARLPQASTARLPQASTARLPQASTARLPHGITAMLADPGTVDPELGRRIINGIFAEADALEDMLPGFDFGEALEDMTFARTLSETFSVMEAYNAMTRMPRRAPRAAIAQNGQNAVRGTGESSVNPAGLESADFMKYIEKLRNR